jgi:hypothetical protein
MTGGKAPRQRWVDLAGIALFLGILSVATFAFTEACSPGATPVCGPDSGCGPGPFPDTGLGDVAVE